MMSYSAETRKQKVYFIQNHIVDYYNNMIA